MGSMLLKIIFPPSSMLITAISVLHVVSYANAGYSEVKGQNMQYSKFWNVKAASNKAKLSGRTGMLLAYTPAFLAGVASFGLFPNEGFRFLLVKSALTIHFFKRIFEVLFIHKFSGSMNLDTATLISLSYFMCTAMTIYAQHLTRGLLEPSIDLKNLGIALFLIGISGNFYHHFLLSKMRSKKNDTEYMIPKGGLFEVVICPHYLFEILGFWGISFVSQTLYAFCFALGTTFYLTGRSYVTRNWYLSKFEDFPKDVKAIFPFVF